VTCHRCQNEAFKFGIQNGFQMYRCRTYSKTFSDIPARPLDELRVDEKKAFQVIGLLCEGMGIRAIERLTQLTQLMRMYPISKQRIYALLKRKI